MHIVQMANFHSPTSGGIRVALHELAVLYTAAGHQVTQVLPGPHNSVQSDGLYNVVRIRGPKIPGLGGYRMAVDLKNIRQVIGRLRPDVVELSDRTTMLTVTRPNRRMGIPTVLISHERLEAVISHVMSSPRLVRALVHGYNRRVLSRVEAVVCASGFAADEYRDFNAAHIVRIPLGVDLTQFRPLARLNSPISGDGNKIRLIAVTRHSPEKDPHLPIAVVKDLLARGHQVSLDMVGTGPMASELESMARGLPVVFHGHVSDRDRVASLLAHADVAIAPGPNETFGLAALEALACGTPVVVPTRGALSEIVLGGLVGERAESTGSAMADAVETVLAAGDTASRQQACRERAEQFPWSATAERLLNLYESMRQVAVAV